MPFEARILTLAGLARFDLPGHTMRLCDGGQVIWGAETYRSKDEIFGSIAEVEEVEEKSGDEAPGGSLAFLPVSTAAAAQLSQPSYQNSRVRFWLAEVDAATGEVSGDPELLADMLLDTTKLVGGKSKRRLEMELIAYAERLFLINDGNVLSPRFHKSVWPGEAGLDNATGVPLTVAWGVKGPPRGSVSAGSGGGTGNSGGGLWGGVARAAA